MSAMSARAKSQTVSGEAGTGPMAGPSGASGRKEDRWAVQ